MNRQTAAHLVTTLAAGAVGASIVIVIVWSISLPATLRFAAANNGLAAWVQAVFSVLAIVGTWAVGERQAAHARKLRLEEDLAAAGERRAAEHRRIEAVRTSAMAYAALAVQRLYACKAVFEDDHSFSDVEGVRHDLAYTRQILMDFRVSELGSAREMLIFTTFAGLLGSSLTAVERELELARKHPQGWVPGFAEAMLAEFRVALIVAEEREASLKDHFDAERAFEHDEQFGT